MLRETGDAMLREAGDCFRGGRHLHETLRRLAGRLADEGIPYAIVGGLALGHHRYVLMTDDVDVIVTRDGLERFHERCVGRRYVRAPSGARRFVRAGESGVRICLVGAPDFIDRQSFQIFVWKGE